MTESMTTASRWAVLPIGLAMAVVVGAWAAVSRDLSGTGSTREALQYVALVVALVAGVAVAWLVGSLIDMVAGAVAGVTLTSTLLAGGLEYPNANAAVAVQSAALLAVVLVQRGVFRPLIALVLMPFLVLMFEENARAGAVLLTLVTLAALVPWSPRRPRALVVLAVAGAALVGGLIVAQLLVAGLGLTTPRFVQAVSDARVELWSDAAQLIAERPLVGHGPGAFSLLSPTATSEPALRAAHSAPLEIAADLGLVGLVIAAVVVLGGYVAIARMPSSASLVALAAWTGLWLHSLLDYVADYPAVLFVAGLVLGAAAQPPISRARVRGRRKARVPVTREHDARGRDEDGHVLRE